MNLPLAGDAIRELVHSELSLRSRVGYVALVLGALAMTAVVGALWLTEPALPVRTRIAFAAMIVIGLSWVAFGIRVLTSRRVLLANHSVVAGRMAVTFTSAFVAGAAAVGYATGRPGPYLAAVFGLGLLGCAAFLLARARRQFAMLSERRGLLQRQIDALK